MAQARLAMHNMEQMIDTNPEKVSSSDVISLKRDISQLADIIEDQYVEYGIILSFKRTEHQMHLKEPLNNLMKSFEALDKTITRIEENAETIRSYYMLFQQEKATRKINTLTIIQAIFVPLTFIAGVYGMNFVNMPELKWEHGYFVTIASFTIIAGFLLWLFYKKGWFE